MLFDLFRLFLLSFFALGGLSFAFRPRSAKNLFLAVLGELAAFIVFVAVALHFALTPNLSMVNAASDMNKLFAKAGGSEKVRKEADEIFHRFGCAAYRPLFSEVLKNYPAIAALGEAITIFPGAPGYISIRSGAHLNCYFIEVIDMSDSRRYRKDENTLKTGRGVYVHR